jgi:GH15 family glucan-1,4-alpha-glucosidase
MLSPVAPVRGHARRYQPDTLIMETDFEVQDGAVRVTDFMPVGDGPSSVVRIVTGLHGVVEMDSALRLRFNYGELAPLLEHRDGGVEARIGPDCVVLRTDAHIELAARTIRSRFTVKAGDCVSFTMTCKRAHDAPPQPLDVQHALDETQRFWRNWIATFDDSRTA